MKTNHQLATWGAICVAAVLFAGCSRGAGNPNESPPMTAAAPSTSTEKGGIARSTGVPDGVLTASGLTVPKGFEVNVFAEGLKKPRRFTIAPGGSPEKYDVFVSESRANTIRVLRETNGDGKADEKIVFTQQVNQPYGIAFSLGYIYIGNTDAVTRFPYKDGQTSTDEAPQQIAKLTAGGYNQHWTRNLLFSRDGKRLFVSVGSSCNVCEESDPQRAAISVMNPDGSDRRVFASGMRNPVGMALRPGTDELWSVINERDRLGDDTPPDYMTHVEDNAFYGWPYAYTGLDRKVVPDPKFGDDNPDKVKSTQPPTVPVQAHSAALGLAFYPIIFADGTQPVGYDEFPLVYSGDAFLAFHGSWNRSEKTGYKIVRVDFENGKAVSISDFVTGFLKSDGQVTGRPVDVQIAPDGSLLFSDDGGGKIWRVSRSK